MHKTLPLNIKDLLNGKPVEWERLEFKEGWNPLGTLHTICAFALGFSAIQPYYHPLVVPVEVSGRLILVLWVLGGQTRPYKAKLSMARESHEFGYFIRRGSSTIRARGADEAELISLAATVPFDDRFNQQARMRTFRVTCCWSICGRSVVI